MNLVIVTDTYGDSINGVVRTLQNTQRVLIDRNINVSIVEPSLFKSFHMPFSHDDRLCWNLWRVGSVISDLKPTHLHIATEGPLGLAARIWAKNEKFYNYTTSYHTLFPEYVKKYLGFGDNLVYRYLRWFHGMSHAIMVNTPSMRTLLHSKEFSNLVIWGRGVESDYHIGRDDNFYANLPRPILLNVGRISIEKNLPVFYQMPYIGTKVQVGDGPLLEKYRKTYPDVHFIGAISDRSLLAKYYQNADIFVFPSLTDTYGLVNQESMACGTPVLAYDVTGPRDVITNGVNGILVPLGHSLEEFAACADIVLRLNRNNVAASMTEQTWESTTDQFLSHIVET